MKKRGAVHLFLAVLEGLLSGGCFYLAKRDKDPLHLFTGCVWLLCSFFHGLLGIQERADNFIILTEETEDD